MSLSDEFLKNLVNHLDTKKDYLQVWIDLRAKCEGWLKGEILYVLKNKMDSSIKEFDCERKYKENNRCDIFFKSGEKEFWIEMKTVPTNYCPNFNEYGRSKLIGVDQIRTDMEKILKIKSDTKIPLVLLLVYPFPDGDIGHKKWQDKHLKKIKESPHSEIKKEVISINNGLYAFLYLFSF